MAAIHRRRAWLAEAGQHRDSTYVTVGGGGAQQLAGGSLNVAHSGYPDFARAALQGAAVRIIINDIVASPYGGFAKPAIKQIADLKGKLISIGGINDITLIYLKPFLASAGLKPTDVDFVYAKAAGDRFAALVAGGVDATILNPPTYHKAMSLGYSQPRRHGDLRRGHPVHGVGREHGLGGEKPRRDERLCPQLQARRQWLYDPANKAKAVDILVQVRQAGPEGLAEAYDFYIAKLKLFGLDGDVSDAVYEKMADGLADIGIMKKPLSAEVGDLRRQLRSGSDLALMARPAGTAGGADHRRRRRDRRRDCAAVCG